jgi:hypothetical protein
MIFWLGVATAVHADPAQPPTDISDRITLAHQYLALTHKEVLLAQALATNLENNAGSCGDKACLDIRDKVAVHVAGEIAHRVVERVAKTSADMLTRDQLIALLHFMSSPDGEAFIRAQDAEENELSHLAHEDAVDMLTAFHDQFCPEQPSACASSLVMRGLPASKAGSPAAAQP